MKLLVVDDEPVALASVKRLLKRRGMAWVDTCGNGKVAVEQVKKNEYDIVLLDLLMPEMDGLQVLEAVRPFCPRTEFIMLTAVDDVTTAVRAIHLGAYDYLVKPVENERLVLTIERAFERKGLIAGISGWKRGAAQIPEAFSDIITQNQEMLNLLSYAEIMAKSDIPILITGETGTGKELMARGIHTASPASEGPFVPVNVASIPETLFENQFFGHVKGAFTGAERDQTGFFERANGGTLFLDEVGELPFNLQVKLLRALEDRTITRVGGTQPIHFNVRIVSATNRNLEEACRSGQFRQDLFYRINSVTVRLPPLRERGGDIQLLADHFLGEACRHNDRHIKDFSSDAIEILNQKSYPGNVRELKQIVERAVLIADVDYIASHHLGERPAQTSLSSRTLCSLQEDSQRHVAFVLSKTRGDKIRAAEILGVSIRQVQRKIAEMRSSGKWTDLMAHDN
jgi:DNA-binding NtrC family response regulator